MKDIIKTALTLFVLASAVSAILGVAYEVTKEPIAIQAQKTQKEAMNQVLPNADEFAEIPVTVSGRVVKVYEAKNNGELRGYILQLDTKGYSGSINMLAGISATDNVMTGIRILKHAETPGLGANATKDYFYQRFENIPLTNLNVVKSNPKEFDVEAITSSTITTRAVVEAVNEAMNWYNGGGVK